MSVGIDRLSFNRIPVSYPSNPQKTLLGILSNIPSCSQLPASLLVS